MSRARRGGDRERLGVWGRGGVGVKCPGVRGNMKGTSGRGGVRKSGRWVNPRRSGAGEAKRKEPLRGRTGTARGRTFGRGGMSPEGAVRVDSESRRGEGDRASRRRTRVDETGVAETGVAEFGVGELAVDEFGVAEWAVAEFGVADFGVAESGVAEPGVAEPGERRLDLASGEADREALVPSRRL